MNGRFATTAFDIAERLCRQAQWRGDRCRWAGLKPQALNGGFRHAVQDLGVDFYTGSAGVLYFLSHALRRDCDSAAVRRTMEGAAADVIASADEVVPEIRLGLFTGWTGMAFALVDAGESASRQDWIDSGFALIGKLLRRSPGAFAGDVLAGIAGAIPALLHLHLRHRRAGLAPFSRRLGAYLMKTANRRDIGWSWPAYGPLSHLHRDDLTGLAHGAAGYAWALLELYSFTKDAELLSAAREAFRFEGHWYRPEFGNWLDLRYMPGAEGDVNNGKTCQIQWCYGAAGAGLARLRAFEITGDPSYLEQALVAAETTARDLLRYPNNWQPNFSLCHGVAGNADLLIELSRVLGDSAWLQRARAAGERGLELHADSSAGWPSALGKAEIPGLMTGVAGTGLFFLRLSDPHKTPSVALLGRPDQWIRARERPSAASA